MCAADSRPSRPTSSATASPPARPLYAIFMCIWSPSRFHSRKSSSLTSSTLLAYSSRPRKLCQPSRSSAQTASLGGIGSGGSPTDARLPSAGTSARAKSSDAPNFCGVPYRVRQCRFSRSGLVARRTGGADFQTHRLQDSLLQCSSCSDASTTSDCQRIQGPLPRACENTQPLFPRCLLRCPRSCVGALRRTSTRSVRRPHRSERGTYDHTTHARLVPETPATA
eukprot:scaffold1018_cov420-Prasinococcus_capsulatus_cf.AAC.11